MKFYMYFGILFSLLLFGGINYYIGSRGWRAVWRAVPFLNSKVYWGIFGLIVASYFMSRLVSGFAPATVTRFLDTLGGYWLAAMVYFLILLLFIDLVRLVNKPLGFLPKAMESGGAKAVLGGTVMLVVAALLVYGTWNARSLTVRQYEIFIPKTAGTMETLHLVMVSDIHFGQVVDRTRLKTMVEQINQLAPDLVLIGGDLLDEDVKSFQKQQAAQVMKTLKAPLGVYGVMGNHEYFSGKLELVTKAYEDSGIHLLKDSSIKVEDAFYLVGRDDRSGARHNGEARQELPALMKDFDPALPVIALDHQPFELEKAQMAGVDLQLSGHTHRGQLFPADLITGRMYEVDWGYLQKESLQVIVSSGFGTWGPPIRIGSRSEILDITLHFGGLGESLEKS